MTNHAWKITIPVQRSEERPDGRYIIGEASGPENDSHGSRMAPEAIVDFARQISDRVEAGDPIPYIDNHMKGGVLRELGHVMEGTVEPNFHLKVAVKLDEDNPSSNYLYQNVKRGKQYGMSVAGDGTDFKIDRDDVGSRVVTFTKVILREISNTTRPSWVPSFGTVLTRSLEPSEAIEPMTDTVTTPEAETVVTTESVVENPVVENSETTETTPETVTEVETTPEVIVERARIAAKDSAEIAAVYAEFGAKLAALGVDLTPPAEEVTPETTPVVENSETGDETVDFAGIKVERDLATALTTFIASEIERNVAPLKETVEKQAEYITALENLPAGKVPAAIVREKFESETPAGPDLSTMSPAERLRYGLSALYN